MPATFRESTCGPLLIWAAWAGDIQLITPEEAVEMSAGAAREPEAAQAALQEAVALREAIYHIFSAAGRAQAPKQADLDVFNRTLSNALSRAAILPGWMVSAGWGSGELPLDRILAPVVPRLPNCSLRTTCTALGNAQTRGLRLAFLRHQGRHGAGAGAR